MSHIRGLLWDVDGVFVDTERLHWQSWQMLFAELGFELTREAYCPLIGRPGEQNMTVLCGMFGVTADQSYLIERRHQIFQQLKVAGIPVIHRNIALARSFREDYPYMVQCAVSSSQRRYVAESLQKAHVTDLIACVIASDDKREWKRKPAPDLYVAALKQLCMSPDELLAFEDTSAGIEAATAAHIRCIAVPNDLTVVHNFSRAVMVIPPDRICELNDIVRLVRT